MSAEFRTFTIRFRLEHGVRTFSGDIRGDGPLSVIEQLRVIASIPQLAEIPNSASCTIRIGKPKATASKKTTAA